jgi:hypothetical protein
MTANDVLRFLLELFAFFSLGFWGFAAFPQPWPAVLVMLVAPAVAIAAWALWRAPKARYDIGPVSKIVVELLVMGAASAAWFLLGQPIIGSVFGALALVSGTLNAVREFRGTN